jgi:Flp pilus assembly protein TadD
MVATVGRVPTPKTETVKASSGSPFDARLELAIKNLENGETEHAMAGLAALRYELPESAVVHVLEGVAQERTGDLKRSVLAYRAALYLEPEMDEVRFLLARALEGLGRSRAAAREYRTVLTGLGPASSLSNTILGCLGLPGNDQLSQYCREFLERK